MNREKFLDLLNRRKDFWTRKEINPKIRKLKWEKEAVISEIEFMLKLIQKEENTSVQAFRAWWFHSINGKRETFYNYEPKAPEQAFQWLNSKAREEVKNEAIEFNSGGFEFLNEQKEWEEWYSEEGLDVWEFGKENE